jgi:hypothetical protein
MTTRREAFQRSNLSEKGTWKWNDFYRALVIDAHDERQLGRVKVRIPDLMPEDDATQCGPWKEKGLWAHPANNYLGGRNVQDTMGQRADFEDAWYQGSCLIPPKGSWVWLFFENGDPNHPYYFGAGDYGQRKVLPENQQGPEWEKKWTLIKTKKGRCIVISDDEDDCRVEITGKKRMINNPPDGDDASVFTIDGNQTVIFLDERESHEKLLIKDYRGNYINIRTNDGGVVDQLHVFFQDDIHVETLKNLYIKTGEDMHVETGGSYLMHAKAKRDLKSDSGTKEQALSFNRVAMTSDKRLALLQIGDTAGLKASRAAGVMVSDTAGVTCSRFAGATIKDTTTKETITAPTIDLIGTKSTLYGAALSQVVGEGVINVKGAVTMIQCGKVNPTFASAIPNAAIPSLAKSATPAEPYGERDQEPNPQGVVNPVVPPEDMEPPVMKVVSPVVKDPYMIHVGGVPTQQPEFSMPATPIIPLIPSGGGAPPPPPPPPTCELKGGVGHLFALLLKDEYRDKIIPLVDKSYGKYTGFGIFKDPQGSNSYNHWMDTSYFDPAAIPVYDNYRDPTQWVIDENTKWWTNLDEFCEQAIRYQMIVVPTLMDFCCSPYDPFITKLPNPYKGSNWDANIQGEFIKKVIQHIKDTGVDYIINLGFRAYTPNETDPVKLLPDSIYIRNMVKYLIDECGIPSNKLSLSANSEHDLYSKNPYCRYKMYTGPKSPLEDEINNEEYVDGQWGGTGRLAVYNDKGDLIDGYVKYLMEACSGIPCMSMWKMTHFEPTIPITCAPENVMNYLFAPTQREAMRYVYGDAATNNGFIDFT